MRRTILAALVAVVCVAGTAAAAGESALDPTFSGDGFTGTFGAGAIAYAVAVDGQDRVVVAGTTIDGAIDLAVARFTPGGKPDATFGGGDGRVRIDLGASEFAFDLAIDASDRPILAGKSSDGIHDMMLVARLTTDGALDPTFAGGDGVATVDFGKAFQSAEAVDRGPAGGIVIGGSISGGSITNVAVAALLVDGTLDASFGGGDGRVTVNLSTGAEQITDLLVRDDGTIDAGGYAETKLTPRFAALQMHPDGKLDRSFSKDGMAFANLGPGADVARAITRQGNGAIVLAGQATADGAHDWGLARFDGAGVLDPSFSSDGVRILPFPGSLDEAFDVRARGEGLWVAGRARGSSQDMVLVRLRGGGALDPTFSGDGVARVDPFGGDDAARSLAIQPDGAVVIAGEAERDGVLRFGVARLLFV